MSAMTPYVRKGCACVVRLSGRGAAAPRPPRPNRAHALTRDAPPAPQPRPRWCQARPAASTLVLARGRGPDQAQT